MALHQQGDRHPQKRNRPASTGRSNNPNLAAWRTVDSIEKRPLQQWGSAVLQSLVEHKARKQMRAERSGHGAK